MDGFDPSAAIIVAVVDPSAMTIALLIALAGSLALMALIVKRLEQA
ncbi:hypothetical protein [Cyanobium sp. Maggiore-St4-Cus]|nr:hypothetical protein [Cyanobium sp. Maggiore-St4-Cus]